MKILSMFTLEHRLSMHQGLAHTDVFTLHICEQADMPDPKIMSRMQHGEATFSLFLKTVTLMCISVISIHFLKYFPNLCKNYYISHRTVKVLVCFFF